MAGAKIPTGRRKKRSGSTSRPSPSSIRAVRQSHSPTAREAAALLGISAATLRRRAQKGLIRAVIDAEGHYHFPVTARAPRAAVAARGPVSRATKKKLLAQKKRHASKRAPLTPPRKKRGTKSPSLPTPIPKPQSPLAPSVPRSPPRKKRRSSKISAPAATSASAATSATSRKKKLVGRKPSKLAKKSTKVVTRRKKVVRREPSRPPSKKRRQPPRQQFQPIPRVRQSAAPTLAEAAQAFGVSPRTLLDWVLVKKVRGVIDDFGTIHIPALDLQLRQLAVRAGLDSDRLARKKAKKKRRAKKSKRPRRPRPPSPPRRPPGWVMGPFGVFIPPIDTPPPADISAENPMDVGLAAQRMGNVTRDYVMARLAIDRELTYQEYRGMKHAFRSTYGVKVWKDTFDWIVDEWGLMDYIFDYEALRDS